MTPRIEQGRRANLRPKAAGVRASVYVMGERRSTHENCGLCACVAHLESGMCISNMRFDLRRAASLYRPSGNRAPAASTCILSTYRRAALLCWVMPWPCCPTHSPSPLVPLQASSARRSAPSTGRKLHRTSVPCSASGSCFNAFSFLFWVSLFFYLPPTAAGLPPPPRPLPALPVP